MNVGSGVLELGAETEAPWCVVREHTAAAPDELPRRALSRGPCGAGCGCQLRLAARHRADPLRLEPTSCVEVPRPPSFQLISCFNLLTAPASGDTMYFLRNVFRYILHSASNKQ